MIYYNRILIFDGSYCLHRSLSVPNNYAMINSKGKRTGGILGTLGIINKELRKFNYFPVVVFDGGLSSRRLQLIPNYKRNLDRIPLNECYDDLSEEQQLDLDFRREYNTQREDLIKLLPLFGIPTIRFQDWEGDDLLYYISTICKDSIIISDDRDILQLIQEPEDNEDNRRCRIYRALNQEFWDKNKLKEEYEDINEYIGRKCICGDKSDNIPSCCDGVGNKTSKQLYELYQYTNEHNIEFPKTEESLDKLSKESNIKTRKSFINFNENQYLINYMMTNLYIIDKDEDIINNICYTINNRDEYKNKDMIKEILNDFEINIFNYEELFNRISSLDNVLDINKINETNNIVDMNNLSNSLF